MGKRVKLILDGDRETNGTEVRMGFCKNRDQDSQLYVFHSLGKGLVKTCHLHFHLPLILKLSNYSGPASPCDQFSGGGGAMLRT